MKTLAIIQARMGSTRLPGKVLKKICGKPILHHMVNRLKYAKYIDDLVIATSINDKDDAIYNFCKQNDLNCFRGSEEDVLSRFYDAAKLYAADFVVRLTGDCPLIDPLIVDKVIIKNLEFKADYTSNIIERLYPRGLDVELINSNALEQANNSAKKQYHREHVTPYIYENPDKFYIVSQKAEGIFIRPDIRITVDTIEDFQFVKTIFERLNKEDKIFYTWDIINLIEKEPDLLKINSNVKQKQIPNNC